MSDPQSVGSIVSPQVYAYSSGSVTTDDGALILGGRVRGSNNQDMGLLNVRRQAGGTVCVRTASVS